MLAVIASRSDETAAALAKRREDFEIAILTAADLATQGWRVHANNAARSTAVINGCLIDVKEVTAVLTLLPTISRQEVTHVVPEEQDYVAAEMNAFLSYWLTSLACPVVNPPAAPILSSPRWSRERLNIVARELGIPSAPVRRSTLGSSDDPIGSSGDLTNLTIAGRNCVGNLDPVLVVRAHMLARAAGVEVLSVHFTGPDADALLFGAEPWPDISNSAVADAVLTLIGERRSAGRR